ncbi:hypothetical protein Tco_0398042 [Tanacetum coccineum]
MDFSLKELHNFNKSHSLDLAQKAKVRWAIEGDENSKYFHGIINKKRSQLAIRGVLIDGDWIDVTLQLSSEQVDDLECDVTFDEIKKAVWDCGTNKSPETLGLALNGEDGFKDVFRLLWDLFLLMGIRFDDSLTRFIFSMADDGSLHWQMGIEQTSLTISSLLMRKFLAAANIFLFLGVILFPLRSLICVMVGMSLLGEKVGDEIIAPLGVLRDLESLRRKFFNGADINEKRFSMISWNKILASKQKGGLVCISLWHRLIAVLYGNRSPFVHTGSVSSLSPWNCILKELNSLSAKGINLLALLKKKVGNGANTLFWEDCWINDVPLSRSFPRLYALELKKGITVADKLIDASFVASFRRNPRGGVEEEQLHHLVELVGSISLSPSNDRWAWLLGSSGEFSVHSARTFIDDILLPFVGDVTRWVKGRIVDSYIANTPSKMGKRFGFVRFMGVENDELLDKSLASTWIGNHHVYATVARYQRFNARHVASKGAAEVHNNTRKQEMWIQFENAKACMEFKANATLRQVFASTKPILKNSIMDERVGPSRLLRLVVGGIVGLIVGGIVGNYWIIVENIGILHLLLKLPLLKLNLNTGYSWDSKAYGCWD